MQWWFNSNVTTTVAVRLHAPGNVRTNLGIMPTVVQAQGRFQLFVDVAGSISQRTHRTICIQHLLHGRSFLKTPSFDTVRFTRENTLDNSAKKLFHNSTF